MSLFNCDTLCKKWKLKRLLYNSVHPMRLIIYFTNDILLGVLTDCVRYLKCIMKKLILMDIFIFQVR